MVRSVLNCLAAAVSSPVGVALAIAVAVAPAVHAAPVLDNGGFETFSGNDQLVNGNAGAWQTQSGYTFIVTPSEAINGFGLTAGNNPLMLWSAGTGGNGGSAGSITASPNGGNFLAADSMYLNTGYLLQQTVTGLTQGVTYNISFYQAAGQQTGYTGDTTDTWTVKLGSAAAKSAPVMSNPSKNFTTWTQVTLSFVADAASTTLQFMLTGTSPGGNQQPPFALLDGIAIAQTTTAVPEPATATLLLAGVAGLAAMRRRRRAA